MMGGYREEEEGYDPTLGLPAFRFGPYESWNNDDVGYLLRELQRLFADDDNLMPAGYGAMTVALAAARGLEAYDSEAALDMLGGMSDIVRCMNTIEVGDRAVVQAMAAMTSEIRFGSAPLTYRDALFLLDLLQNQFLTRHDLEMLEDEAVLEGLQGIDLVRRSLRCPFAE